MSQTIQERSGKRIVFTHQDIAKMAQAYSHGGREAVYKIFPHIQNDVVDAKLVELDIMPKPDKPSLADSDRSAIVSDVVKLVHDNIPEIHRAAAARAIIAGVRDEFIPKRQVNRG